ncbi:hypothetical protein K439DRAFT_1650089 [Ramaria rubella]|nr:hypothetical protein K439DRAFT_1650089 [Ramaria rubella]
MPNPSGVNGSSNGDRPPDDVLQAAFTILIALLPFHAHATTRKTKLKQLHNEFNIPSARKCKVPFDQIKQLVIEKVSQDVTGTNGPETIHTKIALDGAIIPRYIYFIMHDNWDDQLDNRYPAGRSKPQHGHLTSVGLWHEILADGHEKIGVAALNMGGVGLPCYTFQDKWSGAPLRLVVVPNDHLAVVIGHVYLDLVEDYQMIPFQLTVDKGSETSIMGSFHLVLWQQFAPELDVEEFTAFVTLPSTRNIVIEGFWRWLCQDCGVNLYKIITDGHQSGIYNIASKIHVALFNWLWPPIVQSLYDDFYEYWVMHWVRKQNQKMMPSGVSPKELYMNPEYYGGWPMGIPIMNLEVIPALRETLSCTREEAFRWVSDEFAAAAENAYIVIGSPTRTALSAWQIFSLMLPHLTVIDPIFLNM